MSDEAVQLRLVDRRGAIENYSSIGTLSFIGRAVAAPAYFSRATLSFPTAPVSSRVSITS